MAVPLAAEAAEVAGAAEVGDCPRATAQEVAEAQALEQQRAGTPTQALRAEAATARAEAEASLDVERQRMAAVQEAAAARQGAPDEADPADGISRPWWREDASPAQLVGSELFRHQPGAGTYILTIQASLPLPPSVTWVPVPAAPPPPSSSPPPLLRP